MSSPIGTGGQPACSRRIETKTPAEYASAASLAAKKHIPQVHSDSPKFGGMVDSIAGGLGKIGAPNWMQETFLFTAKESPKAIYPLEGSVLWGRTQSAYERDGLMEVQERVFEEVAAAGIWIQGVDILKKGFNAGQRKLFPQLNHLNPNIAWNRPWGKLKNVDLTAQELFSKDKAEISQLTRIKSARWLFSVGLALAGVAYVVPTLNQLKTTAIMNYQMARRKRSQEGDNVQFGDPGALGQTATVAGATGFGRNMAQTPSLQPVFSKFPFRGSIQSPNGANANQPIRFGAESQNNEQIPVSRGLQNRPISKGWPFHQVPANQPEKNKNGKDVRFGSMPGGALVQGLGHMVEQTPYGSILVVDAGIAGGRSYVASLRSFFETVEVLVRDIGSLYFYILSVPHIMGAVSKGLDAVFKTSSGLEPKIAQALNGEIKKELGLEGANAGKEFTRDALKSLLHGNSTSGQLLPEGWLKTEMRKASNGELRNLLALESEVYLSPDAKGRTDAIRALQEKIGQAKPIMPEQIQAWLQEIHAGKAQFGKLAEPERKNLGIALKQAFRHTTGVKVSGFDKADKFKLIDDESAWRSLSEHPKFKDAIDGLKKLGGPELDAYQARIRRMAQVDALDQSHSMLRRSMNLLRDKVNEHKDLFETANKLADWLDQSKNSHLHFDKLTELESRTKTANEVMAKLVKLANGDKQWHLLTHYQDKIGKLMSGKEGRLFSLSIEQGDASLIHKLREMLQGGLHNDTAFLRKAQGILSQYTPDSREFADTGKAAKMRESIGKYGDALLAKMETAGKNFTGADLNRFLNLNRNLNYTSRSIALLGTMFCLGWLVPHVQTTITKRLTGKDKNPGIASAAEALGYGKNTENTEKQSSKAEGTNTLPASVPAGNGIFVGQTPRRFYPNLGQNAYQS